mgnify:CR=1 FL=1
MKAYTEIIITPQELKENYLVCKTIIIPKTHQVLIMGKVVYKDETPASDTSVIISKIDSNYIPSIITKIGFLITDIEGKFITYLEKIDKVDYLLEFYPPI